MAALPSSAERSINAMAELDVFISYAHEDAALAHSVKTALESAGLQVWIDKSIGIGDSFQRAISGALEKARCVLVLWTKASVESDFVKDESTLAKRRGTLFPCFLAEDIENSIPLGQQEVQGLKLTRDDGRLTPKELRQLVDEVNQRLASPPKTSALFEAARDIRDKLQKHLSGRYELMNEVGRGGSSVVFKARSVEAAKATFAIKVTTIHTMLLNEGLYEAVVRASETASRLQHPNIIVAHNVERKEDLYLTVTDFVDGRSLASTIREQRGLSPHTAQQILVQVAAALAHAHEHEVIHHSLRPEKIILDRHGKAFVTDFGIAYARATHQKGRPGDRLLAKPTYMSPEQCLGAPITGRSDQYSLGLIAYEMLTGAPPFTGPSPFRIMKQQCEDPPPPLSTIHETYPQLEKIVLRMLEKDPSARYASLRRVEYEVRQALTGGGSDREVVRASYNRCRERQDFLDQFYEIFIGSDVRVRDAFRDIDVSRQVRMLRGAFSILFDVELDSVEGRMVLHGMVQRHRAFPPELYDRFKESLVATVRIQDAQFDQRIGEAWNRVLQSFVDHLTIQGEGMQGRLATGTGN